MKWKNYAVDNSLYRKYLEEKRAKEEEQEEKKETKIIDLDTVLKMKPTLISEVKKLQNRKNSLSELEIQVEKSPSTARIKGIPRNMMIERIKLSQLMLMYDKEVIEYLGSTHRHAN